MTFLLLLPPLLAQGSGGYLEARVHGYLGVEGTPVEAVERLRPELAHPLSDRVLVASTVSLALTQGRSLQEELERTLEASDLGPVLESMDCAWPQETNPSLRISELSDYLSVERLYLDAYLPHADLRLGRQAINWGSALMINPTDPFPQVLLTEPWAERSGVNALRATVPVGQQHQVQAVVGTDDVFQDPRFAGRGTANLLGTDVSLVGAWQPDVDRTLVGLDLRGTLGVGFWLEGALHLDTTGETDPYEELAVGVDYSFPVLDALVVQAQYYRNGNGSQDAVPMASSLEGTVEGPTCGGVALFDGAVASDPFAPVFTGTDYGLLSASLSINPSWSTSLLAFQNLGDGSALAVPMVSTYPRGWLELALAAQVPFSTWGDGGELHPSSQDLLLDTALGSADLSGLVPDATLIAWSRFSF